MDMHRRSRPQGCLHSRRRRRQSIECALWVGRLLRPQSSSLNRGLNGRQCRCRGSRIDLRSKSHSDRGKSRVGTPRRCHHNRLRHGPPIG